MAKIFYKEKVSDTVWWVDDTDTIGSLEISFDKIKILNLWEDYPHNFSKEEKRIFDKENPYWKKFFSDRVKLPE